MMPAAISFGSTQRRPIAPLATGQWYVTSQVGISTSGTLGNGTIRYMPTDWPAGGLVSATVEITVIGQASSTVRLALYADSGFGQPGALAFELGSVAADTLTPTALTGTWTVPYSGTWWWASCVQGAGATQPTVRTAGTGANSVAIPITWGGGAPAANATPNNCYTQTGYSSGALPATATVGGIGGSVARLILKAA